MSKFKMDDYGDILSPKDVHDILGIGYNKTYELLASGTIKSFRIGRDRKIPKECLKNYINSVLAESDASNT